ncbi:MAG TPA: tetratricopeptide repeat protein, partial [Armatimonadota bacterium]|nr:tetratricopeptide repeat protein [Armatimonadota bacterium]
MRRRNQIALAASVTWVLYLCGSFCIAYVLSLGPSTFCGLAGSVLYEKGRYREAERIMLRADKTLMPSRLYDFPRSLALSRLGRTQLKLGKYAEAENTYRRLLAIVDGKPGKEGWRAAHALMGLAQACRYQGKLAEAESLYLRAVSARQRIHGTDSTWAAGALQGLGVTYLHERKLDQADHVLGQAVAIFEKRKPNSESLSVALEDLSDCRIQQKKYKEAEELCKRSLTIEQDVKASSLDVAISNHRLALIYTAEKRYAEATSLYKQALAAEEKAYGSESDKVARLLAELGRNLIKQKKYEEAEVPLRQAAGIYRKRSPDSAELWRTLYDLSVDCYLQNDYAGAADALRGTLDVKGEFKINP